METIALGLLTDALTDEAQRLRKAGYCQSGGMRTFGHYRVTVKLTSRGCGRWEVTLHAYEWDDLRRDYDDSPCAQARGEPTTRITKAYIRKLAKRIGGAQILSPATA